MRKKSTSGPNEQHKSGRQVAYQRGNQREGSPHYVFLYSEDDQSEDEEQHFPLKVKSSSEPRKVEVINVQIQSDDTLQALALRYRCTISELKRINNIHKDNEIHAHISIKVPVQPYSLLTEAIIQRDENCLSKNQDASVSDEIDLLTSREDQIINLIATPVSSTSAAVEINNIILNSTLEPLSQFNSESSQFLEDTETDQLISSSQLHKASNSNIVNTFKCSGADWGLSWFQLVCFSLLLGFAGPIIYVLYIAESAPKHHNAS